MITNFLWLTMFVAFFVAFVGFCYLMASEDARNDRRGPF